MMEDRRFGRWRRRGGVVAPLAERGRTGGRLVIGVGGEDAHGIRKGWRAGSGDWWGWGWGAL